MLENLALALNLTDDFKNVIRHMWKFASSEARHGAAGRIQFGRERCNADAHRVLEYGQSN